MAADPNEISQDVASTSPTVASPSPTTSEIRAQIEHTRSEMSATIDAIQARLSPTRFISDAKQSVKDATVGRVRRLARTVGESAGGSVTYERALNAVKANPIPFVLASAAATALLARSMMRPRTLSGWDRQDDQVARAEWPTQTPTGSRRLAGNLMLGTCVGALACWSAWRASTQAARMYRGPNFVEPNGPVV